MNKMPPRRPLSSMNGFTLVELMIAVTLSLLLLVALVAVFLGMSRNSAEFKKANDLVENGRFAMQALAIDIQHAGYWGGFVPQYDNLINSNTPSDFPTAIPDPCAAYATWDAQYRTNLMGVPIQSLPALPAGAGCLGPLAARANSDVLVARNLERCLPGVGNCEADVPGRLYMQVSQCEIEQAAGLVVASEADTITFDTGASDVDNLYSGVMVRIVQGLGAGQIRYITKYDGATRTAAVIPNWATPPDGTSVYGFDYALGTDSYPLNTRKCQGTGSPVTFPLVALDPAPRRRFTSNIYYTSDIVHPDRPGETIPTLVRSSFDLMGGVLDHQAPTRLVDGVEAFRVELGVDDLSDTGAAVDYTAPLQWADPLNQRSPINRGDGIADRYVRCSAATPCTLADLTNTVSAKIYVLMRARDRSPGLTDTKTYCLGEFATNGTCPTANRLGPFNDAYIRHVFSRSVRVTNIAGRRETP